MPDSHTVDSVIHTHLTIFGWMVSFYSFKVMVFTSFHCWVSFDASYVELLFGPWYLRGVSIIAEDQDLFIFRLTFPSWIQWKKRDFLYHDQSSLP